MSDWQTDRSFIRDMLVCALREESRLRAKLHWITIVCHKAKEGDKIDMELLDEINRIALQGLEGDK